MFQSASSLSRSGQIIDVLGYVMGIGFASGSPYRCLMGGTTASMMGPAAPMMQDQKRAGRSREAQRQYRRGCCQKRGAPPDIVTFARLLERCSLQKKAVGRRWLTCGGAFWGGGRESGFV